jgi:hypothetical protein
MGKNLGTASLTLTHRFLRTAGFADGTTQTSSIPVSKKTNAVIATAILASAITPKKVVAATAHGNLEESTPITAVIRDIAEACAYHPAHSVIMVIKSLTAVSSKIFLFSPCGSGDEEQLVQGVPRRKSMKSR